MGILKTLFILILIISFPLAEIARVNFNNGISFTLNDLFVAGILIVWLFLLITKKIKFTGKLKKPIMVFVFVGVISLIVNLFNFSLQQISIGSLYLVRWFMYSTVYFSAVSLNDDFKKKLPTLMLISGVIIASLGYFQYFLYPSLRNLYYLGWDEHLYRLFSSFLDPNFAGIFLSLVFILNLSIFVNSWRNKGYYRLIYGLFLPLIMLAVFLTYSRSAIVILLISTVVFLVLSNLRKAIIVFVVIMLLVIIASPRAFQTEGTNFFREASVSARLESMQKGIEIFSRNPILGIGFNTYRYEQFKLGFLNNKNWQTTHAGAGPDNSFLLILSTVGVVGFIAYIYLLYSMFKNSLYSIKKKTNKSASIVFFSSLTGVIASSLFINSLFYPFIMVWLWLLAGVTESS